MKRRDFLVSATAATAALGVGGCFAGKISNSSQPRPKGNRSVAELAAPAIPTVRVALVGLGMRGGSASGRLLSTGGCQISVICDLVPGNIARVQKQLREFGQPEAAEYGANDPEGWKRVCERDDVDLVYCCTHWDIHTPIAVYAMEHGKHVAVEVPAALTIDECWQLVDTAERTQRHCMMLENCCYDFFEMLTLNMVRKGMFGDLVHAECAYIHDLRELKFREENGYWDLWRLKHSMKRNGNLYPTHGIGPVAQCMDLYRGDRIDYLNAVSSGQFGLSLFAETQYGPDSPEARQKYALGDMNTTILRTVKGRTIIVQHDTTSPRPYDRIHLLSGTKGITVKYPEQRIALEPNTHHWLTPEKMEELREEFRHPLEREVGEKAREVGGHGGMDFIMDYRLITCLQKGLPLDQSVYDAAAWSAIVPLSERSVAQRGAPMDFPDFTRGGWETAEPLSF